MGFEECLAHIKKRRKVLGGLVLSGGEPLLCRELPEYIAEIKKTGLKVKLDTNGIFPMELSLLLSREETRPDYIALDLKIAPSRYTELLPALFLQSFPDFNPAGLLTQSAALISESGIPHEYRSLVLPGSYFGVDDIDALAPLVDEGPWYFRPFRGGNCLDPAWDMMEEKPEEALARGEILGARAMSLGKNVR